MASWAACGKKVCKLCVNSTVNSLRTDIQPQPQTKTPLAPATPIMSLMLRRSPISSPAVVLNGYLWTYTLTSCSHFSGQSNYMYYGYTHAWNKLHTEVMNWISVPVEYLLCMVLTWSGLNHCAWFEPSAGCPCLSWSTVVFARGFLHVHADIALGQ